MASKNEWSYLDFVVPGVSSGLSFLGGLFGDNWEAEAAHDQIQAQYDIANLNAQVQKDTNAVNSMNVLATNEAQIELQNQMNAFNKDMWYRNNKYNSPAEQLERARAAGINPNVALGAPVASSPVQQTTMANLQTAQSEAYMRNFTPIKGYNHSKFLEGLGKALDGLSRLPFIKEDLEQKRLQNESQRLDNDLKEFDKWNREEERKMFGNFGMIRAADGSGSFISPAEFYDLSDEEQNRFLKPSYRNKISDKYIDGDTYNNLPSDQKDLYEKVYKNRLPEIVASPFKTKEQFENFKSLYSLGNVFSNIRADRLQNEIRSKVYSGQLQSNEVTNAMVHMPDETFKNLVLATRKISTEVEEQLEKNKGLANRLKYNDDIARFTAKKMENELDHDIIATIKKHVPDGFFRDFLIGMASIAREFASYR